MRCARALFRKGVCEVWVRNGGDIREGKDGVNARQGLAIHAEAYCNFVGQRAAMVQMINRKMTQRQTRAREAQGREQAHLPPG